MRHNLTPIELREAVNATKQLLNEAAKNSLNDFWVIIDCDSENFRDYMHRSNTQGLINIICKHHKTLCTRNNLDNVALFSSTDKNNAEKEAKRRAKLMKIELVSDKEVVNEMHRDRRLGAPNGLCTSCDKYTNKMQRYARDASLSSDPKAASMYAAKADQAKSMIKSDCLKCAASKKSMQVSENYYNPRNVSSDKQTLGASVDDTVYSDIKAKRPYTPSENDAQDVEQEQKIKVPATIINLLTSRSKDAKEYGENLNVTQTEDKQFYSDLSVMFDDLNTYLKGGTVYDIKMASSFMTSLMGPMLYEIPTEVVRFITYGGAHAPLKSFVNSITTPTGGFDINSKTHRDKK